MLSAIVVGKWMLSADALNKCENLYGICDNYVSITYLNVLKFGTLSFLTNSTDLDQTAPRSSLIRVYIVSYSTIFTLMWSITLNFSHYNGSN